MKKQAAIIGILILFCFSTTWSLAVGKRGRNLTKDEVATIWIGMNRGETAGYRLQLDPDGRGLGAVASRRDEAPTVFRLESWTYQNGKIRIIGESIEIGGESYSPHLSGAVVGTAMKLVDRGDDWKIRVEMRREAEMVELLDRLQRSMNELE